MQIEVGTQIDGRYEVVRLLGEGGLAQVFLVRHLELGGLQAVKFLAVAQEEHRERLLQEGRIQAQVRHPNLVVVHDVIRQGSQVGLLMEYVDGPTLLAYLNEKGPLPLEEALGLFEGIVRGSRRPTATVSSTATSSRPTSCWRGGPTDWSPR